MWCETGNLRWGEAIDVDVDVVFWQRLIFYCHVAKIHVLISFSHSHFEHRRRCLATRYTTPSVPSPVGPW